MRDDDEDDAAVDGRRDDWLDRIDDPVMSWRGGGLALAVRSTTDELRASNDATRDVTRPMLAGPDWTAQQLADRPMGGVAYHQREA